MLKAAIAVYMKLHYAICTKRERSVIYRTGGYTNEGYFGQYPCGAYENSQGYDPWLLGSGDYLDSLGGQAPTVALAHGCAAQTEHPQKTNCLRVNQG